MSAFNFPDNPSNGSTYSANGVSYTYDGTVWKRDDSSSSSGSVPVGTIVAYGGNTAPTGWQLCEGGTPATSALQSVLGSGNNVPDLRARFIVGVGNGSGAGNSNYSRGNVGGAEHVTLTTAQMPSHDHTFSGSGSSSHSHNFVIGQNDTDNDYYNKVGYTDVLQMGTYPTSSETVTISISGTTGSKGSGNSHENRPPYYALTYIIKT